MAKQSVVEYTLAQDYLKKIAGNYAVDLVKICTKMKKPVTDEEIGKKLPLKITEIRAILNRLHYMGVAGYQKTRNNKTGWYSYTWEIRPERLAELILEEQTAEMHKLEQKLSFEKNYAFFSCSDKCNNFPFEIAAEYQFKCPHCGTTMNSVDNQKSLRDLKRKLGVVGAELTALKKLK